MSIRGIIAWLFSLLYLTVADTRLTCYHCTNITHTYDCGTTEACSGAFEACYIESIYDNSRTVYTQGCVPSHLCDENSVSSIIGRSVQTHHKHSNSKVKRQELGEFACCYSNQCNQHHIDEETYIPVRNINENKANRVTGLVFRITPHIGGDVLSAWLNGTRCITEDYCRNIHPFGCGEHYRNNAIDNWANLGVKTVKYALYKAEQEVAYIFFNATGSDAMSWFSQDRIINSTWVDIKNTTVNAFGIDTGFPPNRRFYINEEWNGCENDRGWTVIVTGTHYCKFDNRNTGYPYILYAKGNTYGHYDEAWQFDEADVAAVYIYRD